MSNCPCGSGKFYTACCGRFIDEGKKPETAEELMRARYTAYTSGNVEFIIHSHDPKSREEVSEEATREWAESADWQGLTILKTEKGTAHDAQGTVEFVARFRLEGKDVNHHERAFFNKRGGQWYFSDGQIVGETYHRAAPKVGRNDPCPCGSGKKYKHCCGK